MTEETSKTQYVVGLLFSPMMNHLALVFKERGPVETVRYRWNGIGGKREEGETYREAMTREFREETGVLLTPDRWKQFLILHGRDYEIAFFSCLGSAVYNTRSKGEIVALFEPKVALRQLRVAKHLDWIIPLAMSGGMDLVTARTADAKI